MSSENSFLDPVAQPVILVADDDDMIRNVTRAFLQGEGYAVLAACDGLEALELSRSYAGPIDVLISGVELPRLNGFGLSAQLLQERPGVKVIFMSGHGDDGLTFPVLRKPFSGSDLSTAVREALTSGPSSNPDASAADPPGATHEAAHIIAARVLGLSATDAAPPPAGRPSFHDGWGKRLRETMDDESCKAYCIILLAPHFLELKSGASSALSLDDRVAFEETVEDHFPDLRRILMARSRKIVEDRYKEITRLGEMLTTHL